MSCSLNPKRLRTTDVDIAMVTNLDETGGEHNLLRLISVLVVIGRILGPLIAVHTLKQMQLSPGN